MTALRAVGTTPAGWLSAEEAAKRIGIDVTRVRRYAQRGELVGSKFGEHPGAPWWFREKDVEKFSAKPRKPGRPTGKRKKKKGEARKS